MSPVKNAVPTAVEETAAIEPRKPAALAKVDYVAATEQYQDEFDRSSLQIPFIRIIQSNSPELDPSESKYVEDAKVGNFINTATGDVFTALELIPVFHYATGIEWKLRENGGGFVKDHGLNGYNRLMPTTTKNEKGQDILPNGNQLVRTEVYFVFIINADGSIGQAMLSMTSTQLKKARQFNTKAKQLKVTYPDGSVTPRTGENGATIGTPLLAHAWKFTSSQESNEKGKWYGYVIEPTRPTFAVSETVFARALEFRKQVSDGLATGAVNLGETGDQATDGEKVPF